MKYGLLGRKLGHSFSKAIHEELGDYAYDYYEREVDEIGQLIRSRDIGGLNVTIPYKEEVMKYCHIITDRARAIGCVNTLFYNDEKKLVGDNTDYYGFAYTLDRMNFHVEGRFTIILGNGATSKTVASVLEDRGGTYIKLSRSQAPFISDIFNYRNADFIINTTPVGMYPNEGESLVDLGDFTNLKGVIDVVYNPLSTKLLLDAERLSIPYSNGLPMLVGQAARASEIFMGNNKISDERIEDVIEIIRNKFAP